MDERAKLIHTIADTFQSALERVGDERNIRKGGWSHLPRAELLKMFTAEVEEFVTALHGKGPHSPRHEAGDMLVVMAMLLEREE
jgi:hypothetical protein